MGWMIVNIPVVNLKSYCKRLDFEIRYVHSIIRKHPKSSAAFIAVSCAERVLRVSLFVNLCSIGWSNGFK